MHLVSQDRLPIVCCQADSALYLRGKPLNGPAPPRRRSADQHLRPYGMRAPPRVTPLAPPVGAMARVHGQTMAAESATCPSRSPIWRGSPSLARSCGSRTPARQPPRRRPRPGRQAFLVRRSRGTSRLGSTGRSRLAACTGSRRAAPSFERDLDPVILPTVSTVSIVDLEWCYDGERILAAAAALFASAAIGPPHAAIAQGCHTKAHSTTTSGHGDCPRADPAAADELERYSARPNGR